MRQDKVEQVLGCDFSRPSEECRSVPGRSRSPEPTPTAAAADRRPTGTKPFTSTVVIARDDGLWALASASAPQVLELGERLGWPSATLSFHLNQLKHADLVTFRRESRLLIYSAVYPVMNELIGYLTENCCERDPRRPANGC